MNTRPILACIRSRVTAADAVVVVVVVVDVVFFVSAETYARARVCVCVKYENVCECVPGR